MFEKKSKIMLKLCGALIGLILGIVLSLKIVGG